MLKPVNIVREMDAIGRVLIPKELRERLGWEPYTPVEIFISDQGLVLREYKPGCEFCGRVDGAKEIQGLRICPACACALIEKLKEFRREAVAMTTSSECA